MKYTNREINSIFEEKDENVNNSNSEENYEELDIEGFFKNLYQAFGVKPNIAVNNFLLDSQSTDQASTKRNYLNRFIKNGGMLRINIVDTKEAEENPIELEKEGSYLVINIPNKQKKEE